MQTFESASDGSEILLKRSARSLWSLNSPDSEVVLADKRKESTARDWGAAEETGHARAIFEIVSKQRAGLASFGFCRSPHRHTSNPIVPAAATRWKHGERSMICIERSRATPGVLHSWLGPSTDDWIQMLSVRDTLRVFCWGWESIIVDGRVPQVTP